jgi:hypothetical protein
MIKAVCERGGSIYLPSNHLFSDYEMKHIKEMEKLRGSDIQIVGNIGTTLPILLEELCD